MKLKNKSQMEILGLAFVVILISLGLLFYVRFQAAKTPSQVKKTFTASQEAANLLNTMLKTNTYCPGGATITQLLQDCAENKLTSNQIRCFGSPSCIFVSGTIKEKILDKTLFSWGSDYFLKVCIWNSVTQQCFPDDTLFVISSTGSECPGQKESASQFIPTNTGILKIWLDICI